jgi:predicted PurR-regulated permease PerM
MVVPAILIILALVFLYEVRSVLPPFIIAFLIALVLEPLLRQAERRGWSRRRAVVTTFLGFLLVAAAALFYIIPLAVRQATEIASQAAAIVRAVSEPPSRTSYLVPTPVPLVTSVISIDISQYEADQAASGLSAVARQWARDIRDLMQGRPPRPNSRLVIPTVLREPLRRQLVQLAAAIPATITRATTYLLSSVSSLLWILVIPLATFYMMMDMPNMGRAVSGWIPPRKRAEVERLAAEVMGVFGGYVRGVVTVAAMNGVATGLLLWALGIPKPLFLGILAGILYPVPYVGALTSVTVACAIALFTYSFTKMVWVLLFMVLLNQGLFDQVVLPRVVGGSVGLHPLVSIFAMVAAGHLFGVLGIILAVPVAASIARVVTWMYPRMFPSQKGVNAHEHRKGQVEAS